MSGEDLELQMPSEIRGNRHEESKPFLSAVLDQQADVDQPRRKGILRFTVDVPPGSSRQRVVQPRPPPRWRTPEFYLYYLIFAITVPVMVWKPIQLSKETHPNYPIFSKKLEDGWILGHKIDNSDAQYRYFRNNIPLLSIIACAFLLLKSIYLRFFANSSPATSQSRTHLIPFIFIFSLAFVFGLHGTSLLKIMFILSINYGIAKVGKASRLTPVLTWVFNMGMLFANERNEGYRFSSLSTSLEFLDYFPGAYHRWFIPFNITMLRLVSFNMDYHWACRASESGQPTLAREKDMDYKQRTVTSHELETYSFVNYVSYALYPPLFIAGPIMTFNDFMWQHIRPPAHSWAAVAHYAFRFIACFLTMELILHFMYLVAIKDTAAWRGDTPFELSMIGFFNLIIVWLKLLLPWRFFRLWALVDGLDPQENMIRCMVNNYSALGFWRSWHRSFNLWIVRYIYIPVGGKDKRLLSTVLIFTFVALWHDLTFRLLAWGWLVSLFVVPEVAAGFLLPSAKFGNRPWYRHVCALGGVANEFMMLSANLVGFVTGVDGMKYMAAEVFGTLEGLRFLVVACVCIFVAIQVMFEYREEEMRNGIYRQC